MKKYLGNSAIALSLVAMSLPIAGPAFAQSDNAAVVISEGSCGGFVPTPTGGFGPFMIGSLHSVVTRSGVTSLVCKFDIPAAITPTDRARRAEGFDCLTFLGLTTDSKMVATPGGQATLTCKINGSQ